MGVSAGEQAPSLPAAAGRRAGPGGPGGCRREGGLTNLATTWAQIQASEWANSNWSVLQNQSCGISMTPENNRTFQRSPCKGPVLTVKQKPEALNHTNDSLQFNFPSKDVWADVYTVWHTKMHHNSRGEIFSF